MSDSSKRPFLRERVPVRDRSAIVVKSTCKNCGESFVLDVREGLEEQEEAHIAGCRKKNVATFESKPLRRTG